MARTPNYNYERQERDRAKAAKKAEKLAAKAAKAQQSADQDSTHPADDSSSDT